MSYIAAIEIANPQYCHKQADIAGFFKRAVPDENLKRKIDAVTARSGIETRYSVIPDYSLNAEEFEFFPKNDLLEPQPTLTERMNLFKRYAGELSLSAVKKIKNFDEIKYTITHIITVTCTGLFAPGLDIDLVRELDLKPTIQRSSVNFMGCNAAVIALNQANAICKSVPQAKVLVVCTELCTIHFQKNYSNDYILSTALFGDGCAAVLIDAEPPGQPYIQGLKIASFNSLILHKGYGEMAWQLSETGFIMNLSSYVSDLITGSMSRLLHEIELDPATINYWAIHPGGKRILDDFVNALGLKKEDLNESYNVLKNYGNMSSATVLFVLKQIIENNKKVTKGRTIFSAAFGPGLSIETMQLQYV